MSDKKGESIAALAKVGERLRYDQDDGLLYWRNGQCAGMVAGCVISRGYVVVRLFVRNWYAHRLAWALHYGEWPTMQIDHINGDKTDNRIENLRDVSAGLNTQNQHRAMKSNKVSGYPGVYRLRKNWASSILVNGRRLFLGSYRTPEAAYAAYIAAKLIYHPGYVPHGMPPPQMECGVKVIVDITGQRFGRLTALEVVRDEGVRLKWRCVCDCGTVKLVNRGAIVSGSTTSCGCVKHGPRKMWRKPSGHEPPESYSLETIE